MKPLVTTVRALRELATGLTQDAVPASPSLVEVEAAGATVLLSVHDEVEDQRIVLMRDTNEVERYVPEGLASFRRETLSRMANFAERALIMPLSLPHGWAQYKHQNLIAFRATANWDADSTRWIAEVITGQRHDIVFWRTTTEDNTQALQDFERPQKIAASDFDAAWAEGFNGVATRLEEAKTSIAPDVDIDLLPLESRAPRASTLDEWMSIVSEDQRAFINAPIDKSIRLRGPAGSGKTLAIYLKAVQEIDRARRQGEHIRVAVITQSWALASQISDAVDRLGLGPLPELDVFPLLEIARTILPQNPLEAAGFKLVGEDSQSGKQAQLDQIRDVLREFANGDWITYRSGVSPTLRARIDSDDNEDRDALAWDLLIEFGSVIGAAGIFPGAGSLIKYEQISRSAWMLPLNPEDLKVVFLLYSQYMESLDARSLVTSDQLLADFLGYLQMHAWNRARRTQGYDLVFVDEFHLFSPLEREVIQELTRDVERYPRIFMAFDPRQSPSEAFIGIAADETRSRNASGDESLGDVQSFDLTTVHRFSPQILELVKHVHHSFPALDLGHDWDVDFSKVESAQADGPIPRLVTSESRDGEEVDIYRAVQNLYSRGQVAIAVVDMQQWSRFSELASRLEGSKKYRVSIVSGRSDFDARVGYRQRGIIVGSAEYLAGLQFESVLIAGIPDLNRGLTNPSQKTRFRSLLYLALSRAMNEVRVFVNDYDGGAPEVLDQAVEQELMAREKGSL